MKIPRLITRRRVKWVGLVAAMFVVMIYTGSIWFEAFHERYWPGGGVRIRCYQGRVLIQRAIYDDDNLVFGPPSYSLQRRVPARVLLRFLLANRQFPGPPGTVITLKTVVIPLWLPLLLVVAPTAWLWYTDRRAKPWQCPKCRYDLRGLDGGVYPECGQSPTETPA